MVSQQEKPIIVLGNASVKNRSSGCQLSLRIVSECLSLNVLRLQSLQMSLVDIYSNSSNFANSGFHYK